MEAESFETGHSVHGACLILVINEGNALAILVAGETDLVETAETFEDWVQLLFGYVLRYVTHVETDVCFGLWGWATIGLVVFHLNNFGW